MTPDRFGLLKKSIPLAVIAVINTRLYIPVTSQGDSALAYRCQSGGNSK